MSEYFKINDGSWKDTYTQLEPPLLTVNQLISQLEYLRDNHKEGDCPIAISVPGEDGFTTLRVNLLYPAAILDRDRGRAITVVAIRE